MLPVTLCALALPAQEAADLTVVLLPDTQYYSQNAAYLPNFIAQTQWVVDHLASDPIAFVSHLGDIVQSGEGGSNANLFEWNHADTAMRRLDGDLVANPEGHVPYGAVLGNHDYGVVSNKASGASRYTEYFGPQRYAGRSWYLGSTLDGRNHAQRFPSATGDWLHLTLEWRPRDEALAFAQRILAENPGLPAFVSTHEHLDPGLGADWRTGGATPDGSGDNDAEQVWRKLLEPNPEVVALFCGHVRGSGYRTDTSVFGRDVHQVLMDFQFDPNGGNGWMTRVDVDAAASALRLRTFSPTYVQGVTAGLDRSLDPNANFDLPYDAAGHRAWLGRVSVARFRAGQDLGGAPYAGARDTYVGDGSAGETLADVAHGAETDVRCDGDADREQGLIAFDGLVGGGAGQVPAGATVERAVLTLTTEGNASESSTGGTLHRMLVPWDEAATYDSLGGGVQLGTEATYLIDVNTKGLVDDKSTLSFDVTAAVQAWVDGAPNEGWLVRANGSNRWSFRSSEWGEVMERPLLTVVFEDPCPAPVRECVAGVNSAGTTGRLDWVGSTSLAAGSATLAATGLPAGQATLFLCGTDPIAAPVGGGTLCVGGDLRRLEPVTFAGPLGDAWRAVDLGEPLVADLATVGATVRFQAWYRDPAGGGSNLTDALAITFCE